ncbi:MAG: hypothetical protein ACI8RZ_005986 [Myxococcota bacterium]|jgi:hypothetical protein
MKTAALTLALLLTACSEQGAMTEPAFGYFEGEMNEDVTVNAAYASENSRHQKSGGESEQEVQRKIIRTGSISVQVEHYSPFESQLDDWLIAHGGTVTHESLSHNAGEVGYSALTLRVPADDLDALSSWLEETVEVTHLSIASEDVTRTWVDLSARLDNAQRTETRLLSLLDVDAESLSDVLAVERELSRVRGDVESMTAQKRALDGQIAMSTLSLDVSVSAPYQPIVSASFADRIGAAFTGSLQTMGETGEAALIAGVASSPWLVLLGGGLWGIGQVRRRRRAIA